MPHKPKLAAILNITPDSFSDGGEAMDTQAALAKMERLFADGADAIDIGAESTRPGATPLTSAEEWARLEPVLNHARKLDVPISVDTRHAETAAKALDMGAKWINDVSGFGDEAMVRAVAGSGCKLVMMHSLSVPADKSVTLPEGEDVIAQLTDFMQRRVAHMESMGVARSRIWFDPGLGFGKTAAQSWEIIRRMPELCAAGLPLYVGHSRKSFLGVAADASNLERDMATLDVSRKLAAFGVEWLRVHNIKLHREAL